ncbi:hypothetical protein LTR37_002778 [Vermiconidia calcicola]|uniref:Uncharacterized protein n=1 Tax=Vermiconidia calcicola TaxID=1690605 RepID=A0ACC3NRN2_9PEZI|nr:hypothetical protein LTR37_002778 [Vermiconidia calcicola]
MPLTPTNDGDLYVHVASGNLATRATAIKSMRKNKRKSTLSFCQKLARDIELADTTRMKSPSDRNLSSPAKLLALPAELRQLIFYHVHGDDEIAHCALDETAQKLASVCRTSRDDINCVFRLWTQRKKELLVVRSGVFDCYMTELMAPLLSASKSLSRTQGLAGIAKRKQYRAAENDAKRMHHKRSTAVSTYEQQRHSGLYDNGRLWVVKKWSTHTRGEVEDAEMWRKRRESRIKAIAHEKNRDERKARLELKTAKVCF